MSNGCLVQGGDKELKWEVCMQVAIMSCAKTFECHIGSRCFFRAGSEYWGYILLPLWLDMLFLMDFSI